MNTTAFNSLLEKINHSSSAIEITRLIRPLDWQNNVALRAIIINKMTYFYQERKHFANNIRMLNVKCLPTNKIEYILNQTLEWVECCKFIRYVLNMSIATTIKDSESKVNRFISEGRSAITALTSNNHMLN
jgi:hypothetical protein